MLKKLYKWLIWLKSNYLTKDKDNDFIAQVKTPFTKRNEDVAAEITKNSNTLEYNTVLNILNSRDSVELEFIKQGMCVMSNNYRMSPRVTGQWLGSTAKFDPAIHKLTVDIAPTSLLRKSLADVQVEVLDVKRTGGHIGLVIDTTNDATDGTITPNEDVIIEGDKIRVLPLDNPTVGVFFTDEAGTDHKVTRKLTMNDPKKLIARVPELAPGEYTLKIVTQFSSGNVLIKEPRAVTFEFPLTVL